MTRAELNEIKARMEAEHRLDLEAFARIMRFLPTNGTSATSAQQPAPSALVDPNAHLLATGERSILGGIREIFRSNPNRTWTAPQIRDQLMANGIPLTAKNPMATIGVAIKKLSDRNEVTLERVGSGRQPNIYRLKRAPATSDCEVLEEGRDEITD